MPSAAWAGRAKRRKAEPEGFVAPRVPGMLQGARSRWQQQCVPPRDLGTIWGSAPGAGAAGDPPRGAGVEAEPGTGEA